MTNAVESFRKNNRILLVVASITAVFGMSMSQTYVHKATTVLKNVRVLKFRKFRIQKSLHLQYFGC